MNKKHLHKFLLVLSFLLFSTTFFCLPITKVFALQLNVDYPALPNGPGITAQSNVPEYLKYVFDMGMFVGMVALIFSLAIAGIFYFLSPAIPGALAKAKDRVFGAFSGFLILLSVYLIVTTINPNLSFFYVTPISYAPVEPITTPPPPGVYLYQTTSCSAPPDPTITIYSVEDLKSLKGKIKSAKIIQD
ncbi:MAG: hypothetical protein PHW73_13965, partial [Atribacterota bacterium]|nr:hypothetical protein [Atribacterota bacterium]